MPATPATTENRAIVTYLESAMKARRGGGGKGPGSRGGHFWRDASGDIRYGPQPHQVLPRAGQGQRVVTGRGPSANLRAAVARQKPGQKKPATSHGPALHHNSLAANRLKQTRMLEELTKVHRTGKDPHGNKLDPKQLAQVNKLITALRIQTHPQNNRGVGRTKEIATKEGHTGVMIALMVPGGIGQAIAIPGGESVDELHLTLAYLGDSTEMPRENLRLVQDALDDFYRTAKPLSGEISGIGLFNSPESGDTNPFYASFDSPDLASFRATLLSCLSMNGIDPVSNHGFTPHITLAYLPKGSPIPAIQVPQLPVTFEAVTLCWGDQRFEFILGQESLKPREADGYVNNFDKGMDAASKAVRKEIALKEVGANPFLAYKDVNGRWRWILRSSSAFQDRDKETVSLKALEAAIRKMDATKKYGVLDWWHTPVVLGHCDFSALHSKMLVESGTFKSEAVGERIAAAIANKEFNPGASLMFAHNEPGPQVVPGRVFNNIEIIRRSLLPGERAANLATTAQIVNLGASNGSGQKSKTQKEVVLKMDAEKEEKLKKLIGPELFEAFLNDTAVAEKSLELAGYSYKAMTPAPAPAAPVSTEPPPPDKKLDAKAEGVNALDPALGGEDLGAGGEDGDMEGGPADEEADALLQTLYDKIGQIVTDTVKTKVDEILAAVNGLGQSSTKETAALEGIGIALKETAAALTKVSGENVALKEKVAALETRLGALDGTLPPSVRARASASGGVPAEQLPAAIRNMVSSEKQAEDPYVQMAGNLLKGMQARQ